jgi:hypothetical protein
VSGGKGRGVRFKEGMDMDKEFAHGGNKGAFIRFASGEK